MIFPGAQIPILALAIYPVPGCGRANVSPVIRGVAAVPPLARILPDHFSLPDYLIGVTRFVSAGQGMAKGSA